MKKILIGNDDGISAPGIALLENIASEFSNDITVIAPAINRSATSHSVTLMSPLRVNKTKPKHYMVEGTPVDCMLFGLRHLFATESLPDLVLSGINNDTNIAEDVIYSGTVAVAREASLFGIPAIAFSQQRYPDRTISWAVAERYTRIILNKIINSYIFKRGEYLCVNFPAVEVNEVKGIKVVPHGIRTIEDRMIKDIDPRGFPYYWLDVGMYSYDRASNEYTDNCAIEDGYITIVPLTVNMTNNKSLTDLKELCDERYK